MASPNASERIVVSSRPPKPAPRTTTRVFIVSRLCLSEALSPAADVRPHARLARRCARRAPPSRSHSHVALRSLATLSSILVIGCGTMRMYGFGACQPSGYVFFASSSDTEPAMITSSPGFQLTGVATLWFAVSCSESSTRSTSSKLRPVVIG